MKRILIISAYYAPKIHVAANRAVAMAKYFKKSGFEVTVLTEDHDGMGLKDARDLGIRILSVSGKHILNRETFLDTPGILVHKLRALKNKVLNFLVSDDLPGFYYGFKRFLLRGEQSDLLQSFDFIVSTYAPLATHLIALEIKKIHPGVTWVADFRDEMSFLPRYNFFLKNRLRSLERKILLSCDVVTTISAPLLEQFKSVVAANKKRDFLEVRNGFDFELHTEVETRSDVFSIVYAGTFYGARNPVLFFEALKLFKKKYSSQKFRFEIYGGNSSVMIPEILVPFVRYNNKVAYPEIRERLVSASCLLLIEPSEGRIGGYTGKLFDYLAVNRPILAYVKKYDVAAQLIEECNAGFVSEYFSVEDAFQNLEMLYRAWVDGHLPKRNWELIKQQSRKNQIGKLISLLEMKQGIG